MISPTNMPLVVVIGNGNAGAMTLEALLKVSKKGQTMKLMCIESRTFYEVDATMPYAIRDETRYNNMSTESRFIKQQGVEYLFDTVSTVKQEGNGSLVVTLAGGTELVAAAVVCATGFGISFLKPKTGQPWGERQEELATFRAAIRGAKRVIVAGGGSVGCQLAGDVLKMMNVRGGAELHWVISDSMPLAPATALSDRKAFMNRVKDLPGIVMHCNQKVQDGKTLPASATHASYTLSNGNNENIEADVYLPAFAEFRSRSGYLSSLVGALEPNGLIKVNDTLACPVVPNLFAVACNSRVPQDGINIQSIPPQATVVAANVHKLIEGNKADTELKFKPQSTSGEIYAHFGVGEITVCLTDDCGLPGFCLKYCCGFPFPCICGCWLCGCREGPCGYTCERPGTRGNGLALFMESGFMNQKPIPTKLMTMAANVQKMER